MAFEPVFETIDYNSKKKDAVEQIKIDCKTDVLSESVGGILNVGTWVSITDKEVSDGGISYGGKINFYISYIDADGSFAIKKVECGNEFKGIIKTDTNAKCKAFVTASVDKTETDVSGIKLCVCAVVTIKAEITDCAKTQALSGGDNLVMDKKDLPIVRSLGVRHGSYPIEEEFQLGYAVMEVLSHRAVSVITSVQCGIGCIIVDGEVLLSAIMLQKDDKSGIIRENKIIPFRAEIECEEAMPAMQAVAMVKEKSFKTDITVDEENNNSIVGLSVLLAFEGEAFTTGEVTLATDVFSTEKEIAIERENLSYLKALDMRSFSVDVTGTATVEELPVGAVLLAVGGETAEITTKTLGDKGLSLTGVLSAVGYFRNGDGRAFTRKIQTPFDINLDCGFGENVELDVLIKAENAKGKILTLTSISVESELLINVYPVEKCDMCVVKGVTEMGDKKHMEAGLSVYIASEGEGLWSLAKRLNVSPELLVETNKDLCFPLTGKERIVVYRKK